MKSIKGNLQERIAFLKLRSGDSDAFAFFYDKYVKSIYRFVYIRVGSKQVAEDLTQDIFLKIWQHLVDKKHVKSFQAFIFRIARNTVVDHYRYSKQELPLEYMPESVEMIEGVILSSDKNIDADILLKEIGKLKSEYQEVLLLKYVEDMSIEDIAHVMSKDKNNIRVTIHRALNKLKTITKGKK
ncbi:MAG: RNA polymerase sigma factor [Patescibacteria group bacterium]|jgi:RNA polymerase sigma-70 factor (ECF subfamily)